MSLTAFNRHVNDAMGSAFKIVQSEAAKMGAAVELAFVEGAISAEKASAAMSRVAEIQKYLTAGGASYNAMQAEAAALTATHTAAINKQAAAMARLEAMRGAGMISPATHTAAANVVMRPSHEPGWAALERKARENDLIADEARNRRQLAYRAQWAALERKARESDLIADEARNRRQLGYRAQWAALERKGRNIDLVADQLKAGRSNNAAHMNGLSAEAASLSAKHAAAIEVLNQRKLHLNALNATGALSQQAYNAEMATANAIYRQQTSLIAKLGFSRKNLMSAAGLFNPWLIAAAGLAAAVREGMQFEKAMDRVQALTGSTSQTMDELSTAARALGRDTVFSAREAADAMSKLAKAGVSARDIMASVPAVMSLAAIGELEVADAAEIAARIMAGMHIPATGLADVIDSIAVASSSSNNTVEQLGEAMKFAGPVAAQLGVELDETMASLMVLGNAGISGELGGTGLRRILLRMIEPTKEAKAALDELGITLTNMQGDMLPIVDILRQFERGLAGMGEVEKLQKIGEIFKVQGATPMAALLGSGSEGFQEMLDLQAQRQGVADEMARVQNDNLQGDLEKLGSALADLAVELYELGLGAILRELALSLVQFVNVMQLSINGVSFILKEFVGAIGYVGAALLRFAGWVMSFIPGLGDLGESMRAQGEAWQSQIGDWMGATLQSHTDDATNTLKEMMGVVERQVGVVANSPSEKLAQLEKERESLTGQARVEADAKIETLQRVMAMQKLVDGIDEAKAKADEELEILKFGKDEVERRRVLEEGLATIESMRQSLAAEGARNVEKQLASQRAILETKLADLKATREQIEAQEKHNDLIDAVKKAREELATVGMSEGKRLLHGFKTPTFGETVAATTLDTLRTQIDLRNALVKAREDEMKAAAQLRDADGDWSGRDQAMFDATQLAMADGVISDIERSMMASLDAQLRINEAIGEQVAKRKQENDELRKNAEDMRKFAEDLMTKHNPVKAFTAEFVKLKVALASGLIDQETFDAEVSALRSNTLKSAGPKNIGFAAAVTEGSAEAYSASLRQTANPEYAELKRQTDLARKAAETLGKIRAGTDKIKAAEKLIGIPA